MAYLPITAGEVLPNQPITTTLMDKIRTNLDDHEARLLAASAGSSSIGDILNGSFETAQTGNPAWPDKWTVGTYPGGTVSLEAFPNTIHGKKSLRFYQSTGGAGYGGGYVDSDYVAVSNLYLPHLNFSYYCTSKTMSVQVVLRCFAADANGDPSTPLGEYVIFQNSTTNPLGIWCSVNVSNIPVMYDGTRFVKYRFVGGVYNSAQTGYVYLDAVGVNIGRAQFPKANLLNIAQTWCGIGWPEYYTNCGSPVAITIPATSRFRWLCLQVQLMGPGAGDWYGASYHSARFYLTAFPTLFSTLEGSWGDGAWHLFTLKYDLSTITPGTYSIQVQGKGGGPTENGAIYLRSQGLRHYFSPDYRSADGISLAITEWPEFN